MKKQHLKVISGDRDSVENSLSFYAESNMVSIKGVACNGTNIVIVLELTAKHCTYDPYSGEYMNNGEIVKRAKLGVL